MEWDSGEVGEGLCALRENMLSNIIVGSETFSHMTYDYWSIHWVSFFVCQELL